MGVLIFFFVINFVIVISLAIGVYTKYKDDRVEQYFNVAAAIWLWNIFGLFLLLKAIENGSIEATDVLIALACGVIVWIVGWLVAMRPDR